MPILPITSLEVTGRKVLVRCDFNVPMDSASIRDPGRIDASLDTIRYIVEKGGSAVLCSHLGRPKERSAALSLKPVAEYLSMVMGQKVALAPDCIGEVTGRMIAELKPGEAILLENLRFHPEEEANDRDFSHELARAKDSYVNDAFGSAHRAHASIAGVTRFISHRAAGFLMMRELAALRAVTEHPAHPSIAILGGSKVSDKIAVIRNLLNRVDAVLIGGAMAYTFLKSAGTPIGKSLFEEDKLEVARELAAEAKKRNVDLMLPQDHIVALAPDRPDTMLVVVEIPEDMIGLDIGPATVGNFCARLASAKTVVWNGPLGFFEQKEFAKGTLQVGEAVANLSGAQTLIGGGDTAAVLGRQPWSGHFTHISTGGGATLEYLEGRELPGVKALEV